MASWRPNQLRGHKVVPMHDGHREDKRKNPPKPTVRCRHCGRLSSVSLELHYQLFAECQQAEADQPQPNESEKKDGESRPKTNAGGGDDYGPWPEG